MTKTFKLRKTTLLLSSVCLTTLISACGGTSGGTSSNNTPAPQVAQVTPPEGAISTPFNNTGAAIAYYATSGGNVTLYTINSSGTFTSATYPAGVNTSAWLSALQDNTSITTSQPGGAVTQTATTAFIMPNGLSLNSSLDLGLKSSLVSTIAYGTESPNTSVILTGLPTLVANSLLVESLTQPISAPVQIYTNLGIESINLSSCVNGESTSTILASTYNSATYIGMGTQKGSVCVYNWNTTTWNNLTPQAQNNGYTNTTPLIGFSFSTPSNTTNIFGYWLTTSGQVWRVTANSAITPSSFWQLNIESKQTCTASICKGQQVQFSNVPPVGTISSMVSDSGNNVFVGTTTGDLYTLGNGNTGWAKSSSTVAPANGGTGCNGNTIWIARSANNVGAVTSCLVNGVNTILTVTPS